MKSYIAELHIPKINYNTQILVYPKRRKDTK